MDIHSREICIRNGIIFTPFEKLKNYMILIRNGKIVSIKDNSGISLKNADVIDAGGNYIVPGFIDLHVHGGGGYDTMDGNCDAIKQIADALCRFGTTSFLATTMTIYKSGILKGLKAVKEAYSDRDSAGAQVLGIHLEGPYINKAMKGAQNKEFIKNPVIEEFQEFNEASGNLIKIVTLAPEITGATEFIKWLKKHDIIASAGHTNATYEQIKSGIDDGLNHVTHVFNAMTGIHHRKPGVAGAAITFPELIVEIIADLIHVHPVVIQIIVKSKEKEKIVLITDAIRATGLPPGKYDLGGQEVITSKSKAMLRDGTLAGSVLTMDRAIKNMVEKVKVSIADAVQMATYNPAKCLGIDDRKGSLAPGKDADIAVLNKKLETELTMVMGKVVFNRRQNI